jgi:hypothetical protein
MRNEVFVHLEIYSVYLEIYDYGVLVQGSESQASFRVPCGPPGTGESFKIQLEIQDPAFRSTPPESVSRVHTVQVAPETPTGPGPADSDSGRRTGPGHDRTAHWQGPD